MCAGTSTACSATPRAPAAYERCDDGDDDDCNGVVNDGCTCSLPYLTTLSAPANGASITSGTTVTFQWNRPDCFSREVTLKIADAATSVVLYEGSVAPRGATSASVFLSSGTFPRGRQYRWVVYVYDPSAPPSTPPEQRATMYFLFNIP